MKISKRNLKLIFERYLLEGEIKSFDASSADISKEKEVSINFKFEEILTPEFANNAKKELSAWKNGSLKETDADAKKSLTDYWTNIKDAYAEFQNAIDNPSKVPWSAAFISYVTKGEKFFHSAAHITWKEKAEKNTNAISKDPEKHVGKTYFVALPTAEYVPSPGNNVWREREGEANASHSDIAISKTECIGGNLGDSVKKAKIDHPIVIKKVKILGKL